MVATIVVLVITLALLGFVLYWSSRHGDKNRTSGTSLRRGPRSHTTRKGQPKKAYPSRETAAASAQSMSKRDGASMNVYQCDTCAKWHVGHDR